MKTSPRLMLVAALLTTGWILGARAQQAAPALQTPKDDQKPLNLPDKAPGDSPSAQDQTVVLSPFEVTAEKDSGYEATETLAGTRIRTDLKDVGASISVYNRDFLQDIGATNSGTLLQYTTNAEVSGVYGSYLGLGNGATLDETANLQDPEAAQRVRGLAPADNARNYFITDIPWDSYNTDRVDILRGPNSILYGLGSPAGIVNNTTRSAEFTNQGSANFTDDSWGSIRSTVDLNQQIIPDMLALRFDGEGEDQKFEQRQAFQNDRRYYGALRFDPHLFKDRSWHTTIKANIEHGQISADRPRQLPPNDGITPFWRPNQITASNPFGGLGQTSVNNPYDPWRTDNVVAGSDYGLTQAGTINYQPYLTDIANQQQPVWFMDGNTGQLFQAYGGYINNGAVNSTGGFTGVANGLVGKYTNGMFYGIANLPQAAIGYKLPNYQYGQYKTMSLQDSSIFDFYNTLLDGPTASQWERWNAHNIDVSQTAYDDRIGIDLSYDRQTYNRGGEALIGGSPTLTLDVLKNFADYYLSGANGETSITNPNYGRPYVEGADNNGGNSYYSDRQYQRASLFGELRPDDFTDNPVLRYIFGKQRLNLVGANEKYYDENYSWQLYANSQAWNGYWNDNNGLSNAFNYNSPVGVFYLGAPIINSPAATGLNIPGISSNLSLANASVRVFDTTYQNYSQPYGAAWTIPSSLAQVYNPATATTQASNPANYLGWTGHEDDLQSDLYGQNSGLDTLAEKSLRETISYSSSYQGYFLNDALVATLGWRFDEVKTKDVTAQDEPLNAQILNLEPQVFSLPSTFPQSQIVKGHSTSGGAVLHLNQLFKSDPIPFLNISPSYNESSNFQVTSVRRDIYGNPIADPTGKTKEYGVQLSTKDGRFSFRAVKYTTDVTDGAATLGNPGGIGTLIAQGLRWRNVFLYQLGGYTWATAGQNSYRNTWTNAYPNDTNAVADEDAAITSWNNIQTWLAAKGFFQAWNFNPTSPAALTTRTNYLANPSAYVPDPSTVYAYVATAPQGFTVTADTQSKGDEFEFTANPTHNWRISFNAAETTAVENNVGGAELDQFVSYMTSQLINPNGTLTPAGAMPQFGNAAYALYTNQLGPWLANYQLLKLQQGSDVSELRKWRFNLVTNYSFTNGVLKGIGVGGGYRWQDKVVIGYPLTSTGSFDLSQPYYGPSLGAIDLWTSYTHKLTKQIDWKIQLNVRNAFAKDGLIPISVEPDGHTWAAARTKPVQEFDLSNTFSF